MSTRVREAGLADPLGGHRVLLARERRRGDPASVFAGGVQRQRAPAGTDLEQVVVRLQLELAADHVELGLLRLPERRLGRIEDAARVGHRLVQEEGEQLVAEVVVRRGVLARAGARVARHASEGVAQRSEGCPQPVEPLQLARRDPDQRHEVIAVPEPLGVRLAEAAAAAPQGAPEGGIAHPDLGAELGVGRAEAAPRAALDDLDAAAANTAEQRVHKPAGDHLAIWIPQYSGSCPGASARGSWVESRATEI
jgi:hypothetical protein